MAGDPSNADALSFDLSERFLEAAEEWGDARVMTGSAAVEAKVEQALLEIEHLVSGATAVEFDLEDETVVYDPSDDLETFLTEQSGETGLEPDRLLKLHVDLFARAFLEDSN